MVDFKVVPSRKIRGFAVNKSGQRDNHRGLADFRGHRFRSSDIRFEESKFRRKNIRFCRGADIQAKNGISSGNQILDNQGSQVAGRARDKDF